MKSIPGVPSAAVTGRKGQKTSGILLIYSTAVTNEVNGRVKFWWAVVEVGGLDATI